MSAGEQSFIYSQIKTCANRNLFPRFGWYAINVNLEEFKKTGV